MDEELARMVAVAAMRSSRELAGLIPLLKEHCDARDYEILGKGVARVLAEIGSDVLNPIYARFPELEREFNRNIECYGRMA